MKRNAGHKCKHDHTVSCRSYGGGPGCNEVPLGGDRVLQCDSQRNSKAPMLSYVTYDDSMAECYLSPPASQNAAAETMLPLCRIFK